MRPTDFMTCDHCDEVGDNHHILAFHDTETGELLELRCFYCQIAAEEGRPVGWHKGGAQ